MEGIGDIGVTQIRETVAKFTKSHGSAPVVLVDYLQILAPKEPKATDKQNTDAAILELKRISRDFNATVLVISSFNRTNYNLPVSMESLKESGAIEYSADVVLGLQLEGVESANGKPAKDFDAKAAKSATPRMVELKVLKNRNGRTNGTARFCFDGRYSWYHPQDETVYGWDLKPAPSQNMGVI